MDFVPYQGAAALAFELDARADAGASYATFAPGGAQLEAGTATLDAVNTTLASGAAVGATAVTLASGTGLAIGRKYLLGAAEASGGERVTVRGISGATALLARPLRTSRAAGDAFASTRVVCAATALSSALVTRHCRVEVTWAVGGTAQPSAVFPFDVTRYFPLTTLGFDDVADLDPTLAKKVPAGLWFPSLRERAWKMLLRRIAQKVAPGAVVGTIDLTEPHAYLCRVLLAETAGDDWKPYRDAMANRFGEELDAALGAHAVDNDQDGRIEPQDGWRRTVLIERG